MNRLRPAVTEERWLRVAAWQCMAVDGPRLAGRAGDWRRMRGFLRVALFVGGLLIAALVWGVFRLLELPQPLLISGAVLLLVSEWLIVGRRLWNSGVDEALGVAGTLLVAQGIAGGGVLDPATVWAWAAALGLAGFRHLQPLFTTLAAMLVPTALLLTLVPSLFGVNRILTTWMSLLCFGAAGAALVAGARPFNRPSYDRMLDGLVIALPALGYLWAASLQGLILVPPELSMWARLYLPLAPLLFGAIALYVGLRRHAHAPLWSALLCLVCVIWQLRGWLPVDWHWRLLIWGGVALSLGVPLDRWLRTARGGITSQRETGQGGETLELAGTAILVPADEPSRPFRGSGGGFGGGGADGRW